MPLQLRADSTEYVTATVTADHDISADTFDVCLYPQGSTGAETWLTASVLGSTNDGTKWTITYRILVGPNGGLVTLVKGTTYDWLLRVNDNPERPVRKVDQVQVV